MISLFRFGCNNKAMNERIHCYGFCERHSELRVSRALTSNINSNFSIFHIFFFASSFFLAVLVVRVLLVFVLRFSFSSCSFFGFQFEALFYNEHFDNANRSFFRCIFSFSLCLCEAFIVFEIFNAEKFHSVQVNWWERLSFIFRFSFFRFALFGSVACCCCLLIHYLRWFTVDALAHTQEKKQLKSIHFFHHFRALRFRLKS